MANIKLINELEAIFNYRCLNKNCLEKGLIKRKKKRNRAEIVEFCDSCNGVLKLVGEEFNCIATFDSKSSEEKKEILKKRASEHNRTKMRERTSEIKKRIIKNNFEK